MPELIPTEFFAEITWLGRVPENRSNIRSEALNHAFADYDGFEGDYHQGLTRASCVRVTGQHPVGTEIRNVRQLTILSEEELESIAAEIALDKLDPTLLGASMILRGIPDFSHVPPSSRLQTQEGTTLVVDMQNLPCNLPAREIEKESPGHSKGFKAAARGRRGVCSWVERPGPLRIGDRMRRHVPAQKPWAFRDEVKEE